MEKEDCFAYMSDNYFNGCMCLNLLYCRYENCKFYKKKEEKINNKGENNNG